MSVKSHDFTHNLSQNQRNEFTQKAADTTKMAEAVSPPQDTANVMAELLGIKAILEGLATEISGVKRGMDSVNETVKGLGCRITEAESRISKLEDEGEKRAPVVSDLVKQNHILKEKISVLEGFSRRQNIRIVGVKEGTEGRDWDGFTKKLQSEALDINADDWCEVDRIHRLDPRPGDDARPRHIIVQFLRDKAKAAVLAAARKKKSCGTGGESFSFKTAQEIQEKRKKYKEGRQILRKRNVEYALRYPATITFSLNNRRYDFPCAADAKAFLIRHEGKGAAGASGEERGADDT